MSPCVKLFEGVGTRTRDLWVSRTTKECFINFIIDHVIIESYVIFVLWSMSEHLGIVGVAVGGDNLALEGNILIAKLNSPKR